MKELVRTFDTNIRHISDYSASNKKHHDTIKNKEDYDLDFILYASMG